MLQDSIKLTGRLSIQKYNDKDELIFETEVPNLVVTAGKEYIASRLIGSLDRLVLSGNFQVGSRYRILSLGTVTQSEWNTIAGTSALTYSVGSRFTAATTGSATNTVITSTTNSASVATGTTLTAVAVSGTILPGMIITGSANIPAGTTIVSGTSPTWIMSNAATGTVTNASLYFSSVKGQALFSDAMGYMGIGDNSLGALVSQSALANELQRVAASDLASSGSNATFSATFPATSAATIKEAAIYNRSTSNVYTFNGAATGAGGAVNIGSTVRTITITSHGLSKGDKVTYTTTDTSIPALTVGGSYYVIYIDANTIQLADSLTKANASSSVAADNITNGYAIALTAAGSGTNHKLIFGTMLARTTFPDISKGATETLAISWTVTVG
jgi:hypothetical protein